MPSKPKLLTGAKAKLSINGKPLILMTADVVDYKLGSCACRGNNWPEMYADKRGEARQGLFHLLHKLLHGDPYAT